MGAMAQQTRKTARVSTATQALQSPTTHVFVPKRGYFEKASNSDLRRGPLTEDCSAPPGTKDGSRHLLNPPNGHPPITCSYIAIQKAWMPLYKDGKRMAFTAEYLGSHGWRHLKAVA
jgi:hypothetical protein